MIQCISCKSLFLYWNISSTSKSISIFRGSFSIIYVVHTCCWLILRRSYRSAVPESLRVRTKRPHKRQRSHPETPHPLFVPPCHHPPFEFKRPPFRFRSGSSGSQRHANGRGRVLITFPALTLFLVHPSPRWPWPRGSCACARCRSSTFFA